jgi:hypothetical protein
MRHFKTTVAAAGLVAAAVGASSTLFNDQASARHSPSKVAPRSATVFSASRRSGFTRHQPRLRQLSADQVRDFAVLRTHWRAADRVPAREHASLVAGGAATRNGLNFRFSRVSRAEGGDVYLVPGQGTVCITSQEADGSLGGQGCLTDAAAATGQAVMVDWNAQDPSSWFVSGVVGDGITQVTLTLADGSSETLPVSDNAYAAAVTTQPLSVQVPDAAGQTTTVSVPSDG